MWLTMKKVKKCVNKYFSIVVYIILNVDYHIRNGRVTFGNLFPGERFYNFAVY